MCVVPNLRYSSKCFAQNYRGGRKIHDLLTRNGTFLSHGDFTHKYDLKCSFLQYLQVVSAIPRRLVEKPMQNLDAKFTFSPENIFFLLSPSINVYLLKMKSKDYYWFFQNKLDVELKAPGKWTRDLQTSDIEFSVYFKNLKGICKENKLREFYFKFLHRIIVTKKELCLYDIECNSACVYCQESDLMSHSFIHCRWSKIFL